LPAVGDMFQHREVVVDDGVEKRVGEIIALHLANETPAAANADAHGLEDISPCFLLHGDEEVRAKKHADLFAGKALVLFEVKHLSDDEEVAFVLLGFGPLADVEHVFECEWMHLEPLAEPPQHLDIAEAVDVDPRHFVVVETAEQFLDVLDSAFFEGALVVFDEGYDRRHGLPIGEVWCEGGGRLARDWIACFEHRVGLGAVAHSWVSKVKHADLRAEHQCGRKTDDDAA
jgi:hypothetical protein